MGHITRIPVLTLVTCVCVLYAADAGTALGPILTAPDFVTVRSGNWNDDNGAGLTSPWCSSGRCTIPGIGNRVRIADGHTLTIPRAYEAVVGTNSGPDTDWNAAIKCAVNSSRTATLVVVGRLTWKGPIRMCGSTWTVQEGATISFGATSGVPYTWSFANEDGYANGKLVFAGTSVAPISVNNVNDSFPSGGFGAMGPSQGLNGNGFMDCSHTTFTKQSATTTSRAYFWRASGTQSAVWDHCTWDTSGTVEVLFASSTAGFSWNAINVRRPANAGYTASFTSGSLSFTGSAGASAPRLITNSVIEGRTELVCGSSRNTGLTLQNVIFQALSSSVWRDPGYFSAGVCNGTTTGVLFYSQVGADSKAFQPSLGDIVDSSWVRYVNGGTKNYHPARISLLNAPVDTTVNGLFIDGNTDETSDRLELYGDSPTTHTVTIQGVIQLCDPEGNSQGSTLNYDGPSGTILNTRVVFSRNTICSSVLFEPSVMAIGGESAMTFGAQVFSRIENNLVYRTSSADTRAIRLITQYPMRTFWDLATFGSVGYNAQWGLSDTGMYYSSSYGVGTPSTDLILGTTTSPGFADASRRFASVDVGLLGDSVAGRPWTSGTTYVTGDVVRDQQSSVWENQVVNWRAVSHCKASSINRPITGTAWVGCWEPASLARLKELTLAGAQYNGVGIIQAMYRWVADGYTALNPIMKDAGNGLPFGAGKPIGLRPTTAAASTQ